MRLRMCEAQQLFIGIGEMGQLIFVWHRYRDIALYDSLAGESFAAIQATIG